MPTIGANGSSPFVAGDVVFRPREFTGTITDDWATVPYCATDFAPYNNTATDHLVTIHNPATGIGDICRYMGVVDSTNWRMPTIAEWQDLYGSDQDNKGQAVVLGSGWIDGNYYPLSGCAMGAKLNGVSIVGSGTDARITGADPYDAGAVFLPASGYRLAAGAIYYIGSYGFYRSSTASTATNGYLIGFNSTTVWPQTPVSRTYAYPIRCIRE